MDRRYYLLKQIMSNQIGSNYKSVDYLESTGSQYIKLGFSPETNSGRTEIIASPSTILGTLGLWGFISTSNIENRIAIGITQSKWFAGLGNTTIGSNANINQKYKIVFDRKNSFLEIDGVRFNTTIGNVLKNFEAYLFARNDGNDSLYGTSYLGKVYSYKEYNDEDNLIMDLVPKVQISTNEAGMYDNISKKFLINQGSGRFLTESIIQDTYTEIDHIISTGTQWIDTGIPNTMDLIIEDEFMIDSTSTSLGDGMWIIGGRLRFDKGFGIFRGTSGFFNAYGSSSASTTTTNVVPNVWVSMYFSRTELYTIVNENKINYKVNGGILIPSEYETNVLLGKNQVNYSNTGDDPRNMFGKRRKTKITNVVDGKVLRNFISVKSDTTGQVGMLDTVENKFYPSVGTEDFIAGEIIKSNYSVPSSATTNQNGDFELTYTDTLYPNWEYDATSGNISIIYDENDNPPIYTDSDGNVIYSEVIE